MGEVIQEAKAEESKLVSLAMVAAHNIAAALGTPAADVPKIEKAVNDEFAVMSAHFAMTIADVRESYSAETERLRVMYEAALADARSAYKYVEVHMVAVLGTLAGVFGLGLLTAHFL